MSIGPTMIFGLLTLVFIILFVIDCIRYRRELKVYVKYGVVLGVAVLLLDVVAAALIPDLLSLMPLHRILIIDLIVFIRTILFTCVGMYCCSLLGVPDAPLARRLLARTDERAELPGLASVAVGMLTVTLAVAYSLVLFKMTSPHLAEWLKNLTESQAAKAGANMGPSCLTAVIVLAFAVSEEITFRLGVQNYLAKKLKLEGRAYWLAIVLAASYWSLAHVNVLDPEWVKLAQVFPLGLALGAIFRRYGLEVCIVVHGAFNLIMMFLGPYLIAT